MQCKLVLWSSALAVVLAPTLATAGTVFSGTPDRAVSYAGVNEPSFIKQDKAQRVSNALRIEKVNGQYVWATRGNKVLQRSVSGAFTIFSAEGGAGFIKVGGAELEAARGVMPDLTKYNYMECVHQMMAVICYWGNGDGTAQ